MNAVLQDLREGFISEATCWMILRDYGYTFAEIRAAIESWLP